MARLLLIDDDPDFSAALAVQLRGAGYAVSCAASCAEGLALISAMADHGPDAVLVDMFMPVADGLETIRALRDHGVTVPVIAISGGCARLPVEVLRWAMALGADAALTKPFAVERLLRLTDAIDERPH